MKHLLVISVGPVQEFIAAARRTRDLWFGSYLLSEISKAVAKSIAGAGGRLIFPSPETKLEPNDEHVNVANIVLAELDGDDDPAVTADQAKHDAREHWGKLAEQAFNARQVIIRKEVWDSQVNDVLEFYAAWTAFERDADYAEARKRVMRLLDGRKSCRDFLPAEGVAGLPKSSLDGQRETVLLESPEKQRREKQRRGEPITREDEQRWQREAAERRKLRIKDGEQLDVVGLVKRHGVGNKPYPSVSRVAADPWVRGNARRLEQVKQAIRQVLEFDDTAIQRLGDDWAQLYQDLPYEGTVVYPDRHHEIIEDAGLPREEGRRLLRPLVEALRSLPQASPYLAILKADGDRMGQVISTLTSPDAHRQFSSTLSQFAGAARDIVKQHFGVLIYSGGDDVLAFVPADQCLACAKALHDRFGELLGQYKDSQQQSPTLSVGIAIAHFMEDLEELRQYADEAEKAAKKPDRNGLAVHLHKRSGSPTCIRTRWDADPVGRLTRYADWIRHDAIPSKLPYDLRKLVELYENWVDHASRKEAMLADVIRVIRDKQPRGARGVLPKIEEELEGRLDDAGSLQRFCEELLVARQVAAAMDQADPNKQRRPRAEPAGVVP